MFGTVNVLAVLPTLTVLEVCSAYLTRTSWTAISWGLKDAGTGAGMGVIRAR